MANFEYKVLTGSPTGALLTPWASQKVHDELGRDSFEKRMNTLADDGGELVSASTNSVGRFLFPGTQATAFFRREKTQASVR